MKRTAGRESGADGEKIVTNLCPCDMQFIYHYTALVSSLMLSKQTHLNKQRSRE